MRTPNLIDWGPDGIYFAALQKTAAHMFRVDPATLRDPPNQLAGSVLMRRTHPLPGTIADAAVGAAAQSFAGGVGFAAGILRRSTSPTWGINGSRSIWPRAR